MLKKLSIIIPVLNEEKTLLQVLEQVEKISLPNYQKEIILIDDGSIDQTDEILKKQADKYIVFRHPKSRGKGTAIQTGLAKASGDLILFQDADLEYDPNDWLVLIDKFENSDCHAVYGSRNLNAKERGYPHYVFGVWLLTKINNLLFNSRLTDTYTCYKLIPGEILKSLNLQSPGFEIEAEITAKLLKNKYCIAEVPINYHPRKFKQGKKIRFKDGIKGFWTIFKFRIKT